MSTSGAEPFEVAGWGSASIRATLTDTRCRPSPRTVLAGIATPAASALFPGFRAGRALEWPDRLPMARSTGESGKRNAVLKRFHGGEIWRIPFYVQDVGLGCRRRTCHDRRRYRQGPPPRSGRERGARSRAIGRSRGGMTTTALTGALGDMVDLHLMAGAAALFRRAVPWPVPRGSRTRRQTAARCADRRRDLPDEFDRHP